MDAGLSNLGKYHLYETHQKDEPVAEVDAIVVAQIELRDQSKALD
jgi:hypothetical protein